MPRLLLMTVLTIGAAAAQTANPSLGDLIGKIGDGVQTDQAMGVMRDAYASDRHFTFPAFQKTAEYLRERMGAIGLKDVELVEAPADGVTQVGFWTMPLAWDVKSARLEILDDSLPPDQRVLADYAQTPASLGMWSGPTPPGGVVAEVMEIKGGDVAHMDLRGKLALTDRSSASIKWQLVKAGALGAINAFTETPALRNGRQWINAWGDDGWAFTKHSAPLLS
ncbi:MAG: hypothetical protein ACRD4P_13690, partial [Bryobacteraceae bacterium]